MISIVVPGIPVAMPRSRHYQPKGAKGVRTVAADGSHPVWQWRDRIKHEVAKLKGVRDGGWVTSFRTPALYVMFVFPFSGTVRKTKPNPRTIHKTRPDLDNLLKSLKDALVESGIVPDDRAIWKYDFVCKVRGEPDEHPHTLIQLREADLELTELRCQDDNIPF